MALRTGTSVASTRLGRLSHLLATSAGIAPRALLPAAQAALRRRSCSLAPMCGHARRTTPSASARALASPPARGARVGTARPPPTSGRARGALRGRRGSRSADRRPSGSTRQGFQEEPSRPTRNCTWRPGGLRGRLSGPRQGQEEPSRHRPSRNCTWRRGGLPGRGKGSESLYHGSPRRGGHRPDATTAGLLPAAAAIGATLEAEAAALAIAARLVAGLLRPRRRAAAAYAPCHRRPTGHRCRRPRSSAAASGAVKRSSAAATPKARCFRRTCRRSCSATGTRCCRRRFSAAACGMRCRRSRLRPEYQYPRHC